MIIEISIVAASAAVVALMSSSVLRNKVRNKVAKAEFDAKNLEYYHETINRKYDEAVEFAKIDYVKKRAECGKHKGMLSATVDNLQKQVTNLNNVAKKIQDPNQKREMCIRLITLEKSYIKQKDLLDNYDQVINKLDADYAIQSAILTSKHAEYMTIQSPSFNLKDIQFDMDKLMDEYKVRANFEEAKQGAYQFTNPNGTPDVTEDEINAKMSSI